MGHSGWGDIKLNRINPEFFFIRQSAIFIRFELFQKQIPDAPVNIHTPFIPAAVVNQDGENRKETQIFHLCPSVKNPCSSVFLFSSSRSSRLRGELS
jgi:hypothetical protein